VLTEAPSRRRSLSIAVFLGAVLALTALVYWPGLSGGYVFDDYPNIVENPAVHVKTLDGPSLRAAALASPSPVLLRPLSMLTFGIDWYVGSGDPAQMKRVNLAIHLANGLLVFLLVRRLARRATFGGRLRDRSSADVLALCVAAAWLLAPINFTAVAYIVQRMESLCQLFVLGGLYGYIAARERMLAGDGGLVAAIAAMIGGTVLGALAKESAVLLPLYCGIAEWCLFGFRGADRRGDARVKAMFVVLLLIPGIAAAGLALTQALSPGAWSNRPFTLGERLLTEPRVLFDYIRWSLLPSADALALYHDSLRVSTGLLSPATTLACLAGLVILATAGVIVRQRQPLVAIGIGWFLGAHLLTATVIPLELVFEHRNYFASVGLYLAVFSLVLPGPRASMAVARAIACAGIVILFAIVTRVRALDWSNPVAFATSEAAKSPDSPRTAYELARTYVVVSRYDPQSPLLPEAFRSMEHAASMSGADALPDQGLLMLYGRLHRPVPAEVWERLQHKLLSQPLSAQNVSALHSISKCAIDGDCDFPAEYMVATFVAALTRSPNATNVLSIYANYAINVLHDTTLAIDLARHSVEVDPRSLQARKNLLLLLRESGHRDEALALYRKTLAELPEAPGDRSLRDLGAPLLEAQGAPAGTPESRP
jgi:hypothetical protein